MSLYVLLLEGQSRVSCILLNSVHLKSDLIRGVAFGERVLITGGLLYMFASIYFICFFASKIINAFKFFDDARWVSSYYFFYFA